jgi:hypothetical protein
MATGKIADSKRGIGRQAHPGMLVVERQDLVVAR